MRKKIIKIYLFIFLAIELFISFIYLYDFNIYININIGFISSFIVTISSFFSYKRFVNSSLEDDLSEEEIEAKKSKKKLLFSSLSGFFSYYRLIGYIIFIICFLYLLENEFLNVKYYIIGMTLSFLVPLTLFLFSKKTSCQKENDDN
jgi:hypothetical protein